MGCPCPTVHANIIAQMNVLWCPDFVHLLEPCLCAMPLSCGPALTACLASWPVARARACGLEPCSLALALSSSVHLCPLGSLAVPPLCTVWAVAMWGCAFLRPLYGGRVWGCFFWPCMGAAKPGCKFPALMPGAKWGPFFWGSYFPGLFFGLAFWPPGDRL